MGAQDMIKYYAAAKSEPQLITMYNKPKTAKLKAEDLGNPEDLFADKVVTKLMDEIEAETNRADKAEAQLVKVKDLIGNQGQNHTVGVECTWEQAKAWMVKEDWHGIGIRDYSDEEEYLCWMEVSKRLKNSCLRNMMKTSGTNSSLRRLLTWILFGALTPRPPYQL